MYKVTADKFYEDYCIKWCIGNDVCCEAYKVTCFNVPQERLDYLASMLYDKPTQVIKEGDTSPCS